MATVDGRTPERIKGEIESERVELAHAVEDLRAGLGAGATMAARRAAAGLWRVATGEEPPARR